MSFKEVSFAHQAKEHFYAFIKKKSIKIKLLNLLKFKITVFYLNIF